MLEHDPWRTRRVRANRGLTRRLSDRQPSLSGFRLTSAGIAWARPGGATRCAAAWFASEPSEGYACGLRRELELWASGRERSRPAHLPALYSSRPSRTASWFAGFRRRARCQLKPRCLCRPSSSFPYRRVGGQACAPWTCRRAASGPACAGGCRRRLACGCRSRSASGTKGGCGCGGLPVCRPRATASSRLRQRRAA